MKRRAVIRLPEISPPRKQHSPRVAETQELERRGRGGGQDIAQTLPMDPQDPCSLCFQTGLTPTPVTVDLITRPERRLSVSIFLPLAALQGPMKTRFLPFGSLRLLLLPWPLGRVFLSPFLFLL